MSALRDSLVRQFHQPRGWLGRVAGWIMSRRGSNLERSRRTVELLDIQAGNRVLEIGFGPGVALALAAERVGDGRVVGVDHSDVMRRQATRRNRSAVASGRIVLHTASVAELPDLGGPFDRVFTVNCMMFWSEPVETLRSLCERMRPGGILAVTHQPRKPGATRADVEKAAQQIADQLRAAGLEPFRSETLALEPVDAVCVLARRPDGAPR